MHNLLEFIKKLDAGSFAEVTVYESTNIRRVFWILSGANPGEYGLITDAKEAQKFLVTNILVIYE